MGRALWISCACSPSPQSLPISASRYYRYYSQRPVPRATSPKSQGGEMRQALRQCHSQGPLVSHSGMGPSRPWPTIKPHESRKGRQLQLWRCLAPGLMQRVRVFFLQRREYVTHENAGEGVGAGLIGCDLARHLRRSVRRRAGRGRNLVCLDDGHGAC